MARKPFKIAFAPSERLEREGDALPAADAKRHAAPLQAVALHGMQQPRSEHRAGRADGVAMRDRSAFDVDQILRELELAQASEWNRGERLVDLDSLNVGYLPARALQGKPHRGYRPDAEHPGFDRRDAVRHEARERLEAALLGERALGHDHRRRAAV